MRIGLARFRAVGEGRLDRMLLQPLRGPAFDQADPTADPAANPPSSAARRTSRGSRRH
jgi:hypothetical protein